MRKATVIIILFFFINEVYSQHVAEGSAAQNKFKEDKGFWQEYHEPYLLAAAQKKITSGASQLIKK